MAEYKPGVEFFQVSVVTQAMGHITDQAIQQENAEARAVVISMPLVSISFTELDQEQKTDSSGKVLFELVSHVEDIEMAAQGQFVQSDVLVRKWCAKEQFCRNASCANCGAG